MTRLHHTSEFTALQVLFIFCPHLMFYSLSSIRTKNNVPHLVRSRTHTHTIYAPIFWYSGKQTLVQYEGISKSTTKQTITMNTRWEATQRVMVAKLTRLTHKIAAIQLQLVAESCAICSSRTKRPIRKLLDTPSYVPAALSSRVKRPEFEADDPPQRSAEFKNACSYTFTPPIRLYGVVFIWT
jgi:hypothetical protein